MTNASRSAIFVARKITDWLEPVIEVQAATSEVKDFRVFSFLFENGAEITLVFDSETVGSQSKTILLNLVVYELHRICSSSPDTQMKMIADRLAQALKDYHNRASLN